MAVPNLEVPGSIVIFFTVKLANTKETTNMRQQILIGGSILALLFAVRLSAQAKTSEPTLLSPVQEEPFSTSVQKWLVYSCAWITQHISPALMIQ